MSMFTKMSSIARSHASLEQLLGAREKMALRYNILKTSDIFSESDHNRMAESIRELDDLITSRREAISSNAREAIQKEASLLGGTALPIAV